MGHRARSIEATLAAALLVAGSAAASEPLEKALAEALKQGSIPGLAAAILIDGELIWADGVGLADVVGGRETTRQTVQNIGSVSKLVTATALLLLYEQGEIDLDTDVNEYLPFSIHHPAAPETSITPRQLLTHSGGIGDSAAYGASYACGDPTVSLHDWLRGYLTPDGEYFSADSFLDTAPGEVYEYSNVGYGILGLIVEHVSGQDFAEFTRDQIFLPLGMTRTAWYLRDIPQERHVTPYWLAAPGAEPDVEELALMPGGDYDEGDLVSLCLYSFYNIPDGLVRTSIDDLAAFVAASLPGEMGSERLLKPATRAEVFSDQLGEVAPEGRVQGLGWRRTESDRFGTLWGHGGADPGIRAHVLHRPADGVTVIVMVNRFVVDELRPVLELLFEEGVRLAMPVFRQQLGGEQ